jgi:hypothetical protein
MSVILVSGALANKPGNGGAAWTRLSWILGFAQLGHDVYFVEQIDPGTCVNAAGAPCALDGSENAAFFSRVIDRFGLRGRASLVSPRDGASIGLNTCEVATIADSADLLINISGHLTIPTLKGACRHRAFIDLDPGYTQFWNEQGLATELLQGHDSYFTVGENIGAPGCAIPARGIPWQPVRQPVLMHEWPVAAPAANGRFTTIASWRGPYGRVSHGGMQYGVKAHEFRKYAALPSKSSWPMEIALDAHSADYADVALLMQHGWRIADPAEVAGDPCAFREYVQQSAAEFSVAQGIYSQTNSGWFSDRTTRYLASGRPALVQDTGFSRNYPAGCGLVTFRTLDEAAAGAEAIAREYDVHAARAREIAEEYFASDKVLGELLDRIGGLATPKTHILT